MREKKPRTKWIGKIVYQNGFLRSGIVKNNKPKHDVIRIQFEIMRPRGKTGVSIERDDWQLTLDEAMAVNFLISKVILFYIFQTSQDVRLFEYQDKIKKLKVAKK